MDRFNPIDRQFYLCRYIMSTQYIPLSQDQAGNNFPVLKPTNRSKPLHPSYLIQVFRYGTFVKSCSIIKAQGFWNESSETHHSQCFKSEKKHKPLFRKKNGTRCKTRSLKPTSVVPNLRKSHFFRSSFPKNRLRVISKAGNTRSLWNQKLLRLSNRA